jgi:hypothetical protein
VRATTLLNRLLDLPGIDVSGVSLDGRRMTSSSGDFLVG